LKAASEQFPTIFPSISQVHSSRSSGTLVTLSQFIESVVPLHAAPALQVGSVSEAQEAPQPRLPLDTAVTVLLETEPTELLETEPTVLLEVQAITDVPDVAPTTVVLEVVPCQPVVEDSI